MTGKEKEYGVTAESPIVLYYYDELTDTDWFCKLLKQRFRASGHMREIKFVKWDCYKELPGRDGDLFIFDAVTMSALVDKGFLYQLPDIIDVDDMFTWTIEKSKVRQKTYGVPLMVCSNALICRREDDRKIRSIMDLHEPVAIPLRSMMMYYYLQELCQARHRKSGMPVCFGIPPLLEVGHGISDGSRHPFDIFLMLDQSNIHRITRTILPVKQVNIVLLTVSRFFSSETASTVHDYGSRETPESSSAGLRTGKKQTVESKFDFTLRVAYICFIQRTGI